MKKVYMIGNSHLDISWIWSWQEGVSAAIATIRSALDRMNEYDDFKFACSSAFIFKMIESIDGVMFDEIKKRISEKRFIIVGGWFVEPDCNLPSGENFARQSLYGQRYFFEKFEKTAKIGYCVDSFGHNAMIPQILKKSGMDYYMFMRPSEKEKCLEHNIFQWRSPDDSSVVAFRVYENYNWNFKSAEDLKDCLEKSDLFYKSEEFMCLYGVGNHGGGPTKHNIDLINSYRKQEGNEYCIELANPEDFFSKVDKKSFPVVYGEMQHHASGCYSAVSVVKSIMRHAENVLYEGEVYSLLSGQLLSKSYSKDEIKEAWNDICLLDFHDIISGCCIPSAYDNILYFGQKAIAIAENLKNKALQSIAWQIETSQSECQIAIVVFNSLPYEVEDVVEYNDYITELYDNKGQRQSCCTIVSEGESVGAWRPTVFTAKVPALGYATYFCTNDGKNYRFDNEKIFGGTLENDYLKMSFNKNTELISFIDKVHGREILDGKMCLYILDESEHDTWSHGKNYFDKIIDTLTPVSFAMTENNDIRKIVKCNYTYNNSTISLYYTLNAKSDYADVRVKLNWNEKHKMLKFAFPVRCDHPHGFSEIPFGIINRTCDGAEEPSLRWFAVCDETSGLAIINEDKYSYSCVGNEMRLTGIRSPIFCDHGGERTDESIFTDQGIHEFVFRIMPISNKNFIPIMRRADTLNKPMSVLQQSNHKGVLPLSYSGILIDKSNIAVSAIKKAEDIDSFVIRAYEFMGKKSMARIKLWNLPELRACFNPYSVNTYILKDDNWHETLFTEFDFDKSDKRN